MDDYILKNHKKLRCGYTTGSCATAAAKAATIMLLSNKIINDVTILTPSGTRLTLSVLDINKDKDFVKCAIEKDSGDDPDVTNHIKIYATVSYSVESNVTVTIDGGIGIGRVTKKGLSCEIGSAAINEVPRQMIAKAVMSVINDFQYKGSLKVILSIPDGEEIAKRTFNSNLGIIDGLSILGTTGIVEPMSEKALIDTIKLELSQKKAEGFDYLVITPGNYGKSFIDENFNFIESPVICSNFIGETIDYSIEIGLKGLLFIGHMGKLIKVACGIMNTHSHFADARMEIITAYAAIAGAKLEVLTELINCVTTDAALTLLKENTDSFIYQNTLSNISKRIDYHFLHHSLNSIDIGAIAFSNTLGPLLRTSKVPDLLTHLEKKH